MRRIERARREVAKEILTYFLRNADAVDDLEGIVRFRLLDQGIERRVSDASEALAWLVSAGLLDRTIRPGTAAIFSLNRARREQAQRLVGAGRPARAKRRKRRAD
ncbi:MAG TPA: hypothetical protein VGY55_11570 [Pirellulales bacterium]|nr:hypothetical protein [Xanthobacteraceae bacterium]HEV2970599.1 hypothetical protein [Pirellulales bacterium]